VKRYLLDTSIVSESTKPQPAIAVANWLGERDAADLFIATLTLEDRSDALAARST
jgi:predicted nucleic acid-binding protein